MNLTIRGATTFSGKCHDLHVAGNVFVDAHPPGAPVIDADGLIALPGLVDPHCHLREPSGDDTPAETLVSGTAAAARGGFTCVAAMPNTTPACDTAKRARWLLRQAKDPALSARVVPIGAVTQDRAGTCLAELNGMYDAGVRLFSDDGVAVASFSMMRDAVLTLAYVGGIVADHCQSPVMAGPRAWWPDSLDKDDGDIPPDEIWPQAAETSIVMRDVQLASDIWYPIHLCHISCAESVDVIRWAKQRHIPVSAEVTPHHLLLTAERLQSHDTRFKVNPPLRSAEDVEALRAGLEDGIITMIGTDHAPHTAAAKDKPIPEASPGMTGLEQALAVVMETMVNPGRLDWLRVAWMMSFTPARRLLSLRNQARALGPGMPANLVLVDPERRHIVDADDTASLARNNPYAGLDLPDPVMLTMWAGKVTHDRLR